MTKSIKEDSGAWLNELQYRRPLHDEAFSVHVCERILCAKSY